MHGEINDRYNILYAGTSGVLLWDTVAGLYIFCVFCDIMWYKEEYLEIGLHCCDRLALNDYWLSKLFSMLHFVLAAWAEVLCVIYEV